MQTLKEELRNHIIKEFADFYVTNNINDCIEFDFDFESALYWYAYDYHDGQSSELYSILSTSHFKPGVMNSCIQDEESETGVMIYDAIKSYMADKEENH